MKDLKHSIKVVKSLNGATYSSDQNGASVDRAGYEAVTAVVLIGAGGIVFDGSNYVAFELEDSDDGSTWADVADKFMSDPTGAGGGEFARVNDPAEDDTTYTCAYFGGKRYTRIVANFVGTHGAGTPIALATILSSARRSPEGAETV